MAQLRAGTGKPPSPSELARLHRADAKARWKRSAWAEGATIWLQPALESRFAEACRWGGLSLADISPGASDTLRWIWKRSVLSSDDDPGWQRGLSAARAKMARIGPAPATYTYDPPPVEPPNNPRIKVVLHRDAAQRVRPEPPIDRTTKAKARKAEALGRQFRASTTFNPVDFIALHWRETFSALFASYRLSPDDVDSELARKLAVAWKAVLDERERQGDRVGPAHGKWQALLRTLKDR